MTRPTTLILFAKAPRWGTVKSRLAAGIGRREALRFHRAQLARLTRSLRDPRWRLVVAVTPDGARGPWTSGLPVIAQGRGDLGQRMVRCLNAALTAPGSAAVLIGADIPAVRRAHIARALALLRTADAVVGPAEDGGFWLLGLRRRLPEDIFAGVPWSTGRTLAESLARLRRPVALTDCLADVDSAAPPCPPPGPGEDRQHHEGERSATGEWRTAPGTNRSPTPTPPAPDKRARWRGRSMAG